jgi:hypothetical protein
MNGGLLPPVQRMLGHMVADRDGWLAMLAIVVVQTVAFVRWSLETRDRPSPLKELMGAPYGRVMILHVTLIACGFLVISLKAPVLGAVLLVVMKLVYDLVTLKNGPPQRAEQAAQVQASRLLVAGRRKPG